MAEQHAFALKDSVKDFQGGSVAIPPDGKTLDIKARLDSETGGTGVIVVTDPDEAKVLDQVEALKRIPAKAGKSGGKD